MAKKKQELEKAHGGLPANMLNEMTADAGDGSQSVTNEDMAIPFLRILQKMSPQLSKRDNAYIKGAEEGCIINTVTGELWEPDDGVVVVNCCFNFKIIEWKPRDSGGGFIKSYTRDVDELPMHEKNDKGKLITHDGNILEDTAEHYILLVDEANGTFEQALVAMSSTQLKHSRKWNSLIGQKMLSTESGVIQAPRYGYKYRLKTGQESNDQGDWAGWSIADEGVITDINLYRAAKMFCASVNSGSVNVKHVQEGAVDEAM